MERWVLVGRYLARSGAGAQREVAQRRHAADGSHQSRSNTYGSQGTMRSDRDGALKTGVMRNMDLMCEWVHTMQVP